MSLVNEYISLTIVDTEKHNEKRVLLINPQYVMMASSSYSHSDKWAESILTAVFPDGPLSVFYIDMPVKQLWSLLKTNKNLYNDLLFKLPVILQGDVEKVTLINFHYVHNIFIIEDLIHLQIASDIYLKVALSKEEFKYVTGLDLSNM